MTLSPEWQGRVDHWRKALPSFFFERLGELDTKGFVTRERLGPREAARGPFRALKPGAPWGAKWEYAWFASTLRLPAAARGRRIVLQHPSFGGPLAWTGNPSGEMRVLVGGEEAGSMDWGHPYFTLAHSGRAGARYDLLIEEYAGHGPTPCGGGPALDGVPTVPEPAGPQRRVARIAFGAWEEEAYQAWMDLETLARLREVLDPASLRVAEIDAALREFTLAADLELPRAAALESIRAARRCLAPLLACRNGSTAPAFTCFGHSHLDLMWLWPLAETERKCARTLSNQLALMAEYPRYRYLQSQAYLFDVARRLYPGLYRRVREAARRGQVVPEGGMWVEADTNITGGESLIRQFIHGKRFFREEFGVDSRLLWLPDVFGYSGSLPQIMKGCGVRYFSTHKIFWSYNGGEPFPYNTFWWEGIDGTRVLSHIHNDYNSVTDPATLVARWRDRAQKDGIDARLVPFGWGDGGGGPNRDHLEYLARQADLEGAPRCRIASPLDFFRAEESHGAALPTYVGELYYQCHRGTYTTQARTKRGNRKSEFALREAELWGAAAAALRRYRYPAGAMDRAWKTILLNHFHDIIPGSSIHRVYEEVEQSYDQVLREAAEVAGAATGALTRRRGKAVTVFNSLSWERHALVPLPRGFRGAAVEGRACSVQKTRDGLVAEVDVPSCGWITLEPAAAAPAGGDAARASGRRLENAELAVEFNGRGEISRLTDKATGRVLSAGPMNELRLFKDIPRAYDAWDIDSPYRLQRVALPEPAGLEVLEPGPLCAVIRVTRRVGASDFVQDICLARGSRTVEFRTAVEWREKHKMLKVAFATGLHAQEALQEVQFGHVRRPNHSSRPFDADRFEVCNQKWTALVEEDRGFAVLNDCKYGVDVDGGTISLTLLRSPQAPDMTADQGRQVFTYALHAWNGPFGACRVVREAYELNVPALVRPGAGGRESLFSVDAGSIVIDTVKPAEDGSGDVIVRLYESKHMAVRCALQTALPVRSCRLTNMLEEGGTRTAVRGGRIDLDFRPFEIKTVRLKV